MKMLVCATITATRSGGIHAGDGRLSSMRALRRREPLRVCIALMLGVKIKSREPVPVLMAFLRGCGRSWPVRDTWALPKNQKIRHNRKSLSRFMEGKMDRLGSMSVLVAAVEAGSLSAAARRLG